MPPPGRKTLRRWLVILAVATIAYVVAAYALLPLLWRHYEHQEGLASKPMITETADGIPGDPLNVGLVGDEAEVHRIMQAAGWQSRRCNHLAQQHCNCRQCCAEPPR